MGENLFTIIEGKNVMKKQVFIINGSGGMGKDSFILFVDEYSRKYYIKHHSKKINEKSYTLPAIVMNYSSVTEVKEIAKMMGWTGKKSEKDRKFLSDLKELWTNYNDTPFNSLKNEYGMFKKHYATMLFLHIREPREIERAKTAFNAKTILIRNKHVKQIISNMADANVYDYDYDIVINNNGDLDDLKKKAEEFVNDFYFNGLRNEY